MKHLTAVQTRHRQWHHFPVIKKNTRSGSNSSDEVLGCDGPQHHGELLLGRGGFADVLLALAEDCEEVAVKRMRHGLAFGPFLAAANRWAAEILVSCEADHPHVLNCLCWGIELLPSSQGQQDLFRMRIAFPRMIER